MLRSAIHRAGLAGGVGLGLAGLAGLASLALPACGDRAGDAPPPPRERVAEWPHYGGDAGGRRFSPLRELGPENVDRLEPAWTYRHGDWPGGREEVASETAFEATPVVVDGTLYFCTPFNRVIALDPETGAERWTWDPELDLSGRYANQLACRGVTFWRDPRAASDAACGRRIFTATADARLAALDADTGLPCPGFGEAGEVDLRRGVGPERWPGEYQMTSPPVVLDDVVVVGSAVADNQRVDAPSGVVRGFDARSGALRWGQDLADPAQPAPDDGSWTPGTPNVWAPLSVDPERGLVFLPTGNPAPDYYRGGLADRDHYGSSVVAVRGATGEVAWRFQTVHHDLWDYDVPAQPTLATLRRDGRAVPVVVQATKMGHLFVLHRETGEPVLPVEERPVPQGGAPGERLSPTQPFPVRPPPLVSHRLRPEDAWGLTPWDRGRCRERIEALRSDGIFTPPTLRGSVMLPGNAGGTNWGGVAVDPERQLVVANLIDMAWVVTLVPREDVARQRAARTGDVEVAPQEGVAYGMRREPLLSPLGIPCNPPPWGKLVAVDLPSGEVRWDVPLGTVRDISPVPIPWRLGVPNLGGPLVTAGGLVFIGATMDDYLRAFDLRSGEQLWRARLPAGGQATPLTYRVRPGGRQYVVIAAGGHARGGTRLGDHLVAFALPE